MSDHSFDQVTTVVTTSKYGFALHLDELTDVTNCFQLLVYVRFTENNAVKTEVFMNKEVSSTTKSISIYIVDEFFHKK